MIISLIVILLVARLFTRGFYRPMGGWFFGMPGMWRRPPMHRGPFMGGFGPRGPMGGRGFGPGMGGRRW